MNRFLSSLNQKYMYASRSYFSLNLITNLIVCLCIMLISSCNKDPYQDGTPELPPITMEGKNTLGFLLDGKVWVPYQESSGIFTPTLIAVFDGFTNKLTIEARLKKSNNLIEQLNFSIHLDIEGSYNIPNEGTAKFFDHRFPACDEFRCVSEDGTFVVSKFDKNNRIISGTFNLNNMATPCGDTIKVTDGRFDLKY